MADENNSQNYRENENIENLANIDENQEGAEQDLPVVGNTEEEEEDEEEEEEIMHEEKKVELKNNYKYLLDTLSNTNQKMIEEVKLFVNEMRRITLLREELWYGTLNQIHSDVNKRMEQLMNEMNRLKTNQSLSEAEKENISKEKYEIILQPIISIVEHVNEITTKIDPQTPNEEQFQNEFAQKIQDALLQLKDKNNASKPHNGWNLFKQLHQAFHLRSQKRLTTSLLMEQISPKLASIKASTIPIPGKDGQSCTIYTIASNVLVLPTKTKPKKLIFIGSNGKRYPYLFKGLEDLHLDERIMQFLSIINSMFSKTNKSEYPYYHALNYSVTPLGPRSGLISWVEGATPLFTLYKKWQQRESIFIASKQQQQQQQNQSKNQQQIQQPQQAQILRPNDIYYSKLNPLLKEKGIKNFNENRAECPIGILRQVLEELIKETPSDLLAKELWCSSSTPGNWWKSVQMYSRSTAVMSIIGYIIGLGDRHLDNVLVNLNTGEVAHIDYNICFEKGHNLRVPERVPFRMTQNIQQALGLTGIEGVFRFSCEHVMKILREGKETLLTLLEAFVYDPLLDWISNDTGIIASFYGGGDAAKTKSTINQSDASNANIIEIQKNNKEKRKNLEKNMTYRLYSIRLIENRDIIKKNYDSLTQMLNHLETCISLLCHLVDKRFEKENRIRLHEQAKIYLDESLTLRSESTKAKTSQHPVYTLHDRYIKFLEHNEALKKVFSSLDSRIQYYEKLSEEHYNSIAFVKSFSDTNEALINKFKQSKSTMMFNCTIAFMNDQNRNLTPLSSPISVSINEISKGFESLSLIQDINDEPKEPYIVASDFLSSISQNNYKTQCEAIYKEIKQTKLNRCQIFEKIYDVLMEHAYIYNMLPSDFFKHGKHTILKDSLISIKSLDFKNPSKELNKFNEIISNYISKFNPKFKLSLQKNKTTESKSIGSGSETLYQQDEKNNQKLEEFFECSSKENKLLTLKSHEAEIEKKLIDLNLRKASIQAQNQANISDLLTGNMPNIGSLSNEEQMQLKHNLVESSLFDFIDNEINTNSSSSIQLFESFNFVLHQFVNDDFQKWIMMENALFDTKEQLYNLKSIDGDWYLEEMLSLIINCNHLTQLIRKVYLKYDKLNELNNRFYASFSKSLDINDSLGNLFTNIKELLFQYETVLLENLIKSSFNNISEMSFIIKELETFNIEEFFYLISTENFPIETILNVNFKLIFSFF